jgi:glutaredoxin-like protein
VKLADAIMSAAELAGKKELVKVFLSEVGKDPSAARFFGVKRVPSTLMLNGYIRYTGVPSMEELNPFIETIYRVGTGEHGLSDDAVEGVEELLDEDVRLQVLVTPTCPYCPYVVLTANMLAYISYLKGGKLVAETVELYENRDIAVKYSVMSVPAFTINGELAYIGTLTEHELIDLIKRHVGLER